MISEKQLSEQFPSFWQHCFPLLTTGFVRTFNNANKTRLTNDKGMPVRPVPIQGKGERYDVVAEVAFEHAIEKYHARRSVKSDYTDATRRAFQRLRALRGEEQLSDLSDIEQCDIKALLLNYQFLFSSVGNDSTITFRPRVKGLGVLREMEADLCSESMLFEVKAVNRNVQSIDIRQVLCYLIAGYASGEYSWREYCIFNPRLAVYYRGNVEELVSYLSARSLPECISEVIDGLREREQPLEMQF